MESAHALNAQLWKSFKNIPQSSSVVNKKLRLSSHNFENYQTDHLSLVAPVKLSIARDKFIASCRIYFFGPLSFGMCWRLVAP